MIAVTGLPAERERGGEAAAISAHSVWRGHRGGGRVFLSGRRGVRRPGPSQHCQHERVRILRALPRSSPPQAVYSPADCHSLGMPGFCVRAMRT